MPENPCEPPEAPIADQRALALEGSGHFDIGQCLSDAWDGTWKNFPLWLGVFIVCGLLMALSIVTIIGAVLIVPVLVWGFVLFYLNMTDGRASFGDLFAGFSSYGAVLAGMLAFLICYQLLGLIGQSVGLVGQLADSATLIAIGFVVNLAWTFGVMLRFGFAILLMVDRRMGAIESLQLSWDLTRGQTLNLIGLAAASGVVILVGLLALLIGVIPATVTVYLMWTSAYRQLVGRPAP